MDAKSIMTRGREARRGAGVPVMIMTTALIPALVLTGCTAASRTDDSPSVGASAVARPIDFGAPTSTGGVQVGDLTDQSLASVAARGATVVAVGSDSSDNVTRPLILVSDDAGLHWRRAALDAQSVREDGTVVAVSQVAAGRNGFVAAGQVADRPGLWSSANGQDWRRVDTPVGVFTREDSVDALINTPTGWLAAGTHDAVSGPALATLVSWTSSDGVFWQRHDLDQQGIRPVRGTPEVNAVAVNGSTMIIAGGIQDNQLITQPNRIALWRSTDRGEHWAQVPTAADLAGDYRAYTEDLVVDHGRFLLTAQGAGRDPNSWDGVVLTGSGDGRKWAKSYRPAAWSSRSDDYPSGLLRAGSDWVMYGDKGQHPADAVIASGPTIEGMVARDDRSLRGDRDQEAEDGVAVGDVAVVVGSSAVSGSTAPMIWRVDRGRVTSIRLPKQATAGRPSTQLGGFEQSGPVSVQVGSIADAPMAWSSTDAHTWRADLLPGLGGSIDSADVADVASLPTETADGSAGSDHGSLAVGTLFPARGSQAAVWVRQPEQSTWQQVTSGSFISPVAEDYGYYRADAVASGPGGAVIVGSHFADGLGDAAFWYSADGSTWQHARGGRQVKLSRQERMDNRSTSPAFRGPVNGSIDVDAVTAVGRGFVAVGSITSNGRERAVAWRTRDGKIWSDPVTLPAVAGIWQASAWSVTVSGSQMVVSGTVRRSPDDEDRRGLTWSSTDGGAHWRAGTPVSGPIDFSVTTIPGGFLGVGSRGPYASLDAAAVISRDGLHWRPVDLGLTRGTGPGTQLINSAVVRDDTLLVVAEDTPPAGGGHYAVEVPLPHP